MSCSRTKPRIVSELSSYRKRLRVSQAAASGHKCPEPSSAYRSRRTASQCGRIRGDPAQSRDSVPPAQELVTPAVPPFREAMQKKNWRPLAAFDPMHPDAVDLGRMVS